MNKVLKKIISLLGRGQQEQIQIPQSEDFEWNPLLFSQAVQRLSLENAQTQEVTLGRTTSQLSPIYSGIGLGVYQGEAVVHRLMAIGERHWAVSKLQFDDLNQLPSSLPLALHYLACLLDVYYEQPDLVKKDLQTKDGLELGQYYCQLRQSQPKLKTYGEGRNNPVFEENQPQELEQSPENLVRCLGCPCCRQSITGG